MGGRFEEDKVFDVWESAEGMMEGFLLGGELTVVVVVAAVVVTVVIVAAVWT